MTTRILYVVAALVAAGVSADTVSNIYTVVVNDGTFAAPVLIDNQQVEIYDAEAGTTTTEDFTNVTFKANSIFRKRGTGYMLSSLGMSSFTGEIRIEEGAFIINTNNQMGVTTSAANAPLIVVSNGASFVMATRSNTCAEKALKIYNSFQIAGDGCDNYGAVCNDNVTAQQDYLFYGKWTLAADASIASTRSTRFDYAATIDLAGHQLTFRKKGVRGTCCISGSSVITNSSSVASRILVDNHVLQLQGADIKFYGDARNEIVFTNSEAVFQTYACKPEISLWTMRFAGSVFANMQQGDRQNPGLNGGNRWRGPVVLDGPNAAMKIRTLNVKYDGDGFLLTNTVSGTGSFLIQNAVLQLAHPTNSFTGRVGAFTDVGRTGLVALWYPWSLPPTSAGLFVTNTAVSLISHERYDLPPIEVHVVSGTNVVFTGGCGGFAPSFRKTGPGRLDLAYPLTVTGRAEVADGTLMFSRYARAGLVAGRYQYPNRKNFDLPDGSHWTSDANAVASATMNLTNWVECVLECLTTTKALLGYIPADFEGPDVGIIVMYNGYIWNRSGETQRWTFGGGMGTHVHVWLDSEHPIAYGQYQTGKKGTVNVTPGAHRFRITSYTTGRGSYLGPAGANFTNMTWKIGSTGAGLRYDPQGRDSANCADYIPINDPGDGSLLTVSTNDTLTTVQDEPSFWTLRLAPGATLDTFGNGIAVGNLEGLGMVTNSNAYFNHPMTVTNSWTISAADVNAGGILRMHVPLAFAAGATFAAEDLALFPRSNEPLTLCTADVPIEGMPAFDRLANRTTRKWKLFKSVDGKSIQFQYRNSISISFR